MRLKKLVKFRVIFFDPMSDDKAIIHRDLYIEDSIRKHLSSSVKHSVNLFFLILDLLSRVERLLSINWLISIIILLSRV